MDISGYSSLLAGNSRPGVTEEVSKGLNPGGGMSNLQYLVTVCKRYISSQLHQSRNNK